MHLPAMTKGSAAIAAAWLALNISAALSITATLIPTIGLLLGVPARADDLSDLLGSYSDSQVEVRASQPAWSSPLVTTTAMLEQRLRFDVEQQHSGNGVDTT